MRAASAVVVGLLLGFVGALLQAWQVPIGTVRLPVGTVLVLAALVPVARGCAWWVGSRAGAVAFSVGWLAATLAMSTTMPGGDLVLTSGTRQLSYLVGGTMLLAAACGYPLLAPDEHDVVDGHASGTAAAPEA